MSTAGYGEPRAFTAEDAEGAEAAARNSKLCAVPASSAPAMKEEEDILEEKSQRSLTSL